MSLLSKGSKLSIAKGREVVIEEVFLHRLLEENIIKNNVNEKTALIYSGKFGEPTETSDFTCKLEFPRQMKASKNAKPNTRN